MEEVVLVVAEERESDLSSRNIRTADLVKEGWLRQKWLVRAWRKKSAKRVSKSAYWSVQRRETRDATRSRLTRRNGWSHSCISARHTSFSLSSFERSRPDLSTGRRENRRDAVAFPTSRWSRIFFRGRRSYSFTEHLESERTMRGWDGKFPNRALGNCENRERIMPTHIASPRKSGAKILRRGVSTSRGKLFRSRTDSPRNFLIRDSLRARFDRIKRRSIRRIIRSLVCWGKRYVVRVALFYWSYPIWRAFRIGCVYDFSKRGLGTLYNARVILKRFRFLPWQLHCVWNCQVMWKKLYENELFY